ncbi:hypothetical protein [Propionivibrio sp.]|uniref:hypothetical protein n=1 Tax=Propionivibrio sp. TaxID=2212460 RepID=UPI00261AD812|nr:hypothetical protein [Propionivibrio sp.]
MIQSVLHVLNGERGLGTYPSVYNAMQVLSEHGWENHIFTGGTIDGFESIIKDRHDFVGGYLRRAYQLARLKGDFDLVILYEPRDVEIYQLSRLMMGKVETKCLAHHSLEIPTESWRGSLLNSLAHRFLYQGYLRIDRLIIQDVVRKDLLLKYFPALNEIKCNYVPNSYLPELEPVSEKIRWFDELRAEKRWFVLYVGAIERWALSLDLFRSIKDMKNVGFLFSGWSNDGLAQDAVALCSGLNHIHFDLRIKDRAEFNYMVKNSDLGLVFYDSNDPNVAVIGLSSGKLHKFLSYGKPVVINELPSMKVFLEDNGFGLSSHPQDIPGAIAGIFSDYENHVDHINKKYVSMINYRSAYSEFIDSLPFGTVASSKQ